ncbi:hypothetical protein ACGF0J_28455 [Nonomuraea sp. NPDC047897]|uniref:hypothetical protein n=1 Tax=Nonomuraea sp. NPDC047897 TaxID=3364346 RepID=UPI0037157B6F
MRVRGGGRTATVAAILLLATACARGADPAVAPQRAPGTPTTPATPDAGKAALAEAAKSLAALMSAPGPVVCSRSGDHWQAAAYDDAFRTRTAHFSSATIEPHLMEVAAKAGGDEASVRGLCEAGVSSVSPDGRRVAVEVGLADSTGTRVGWLDLGTGVFTDVTATSNKKGYVSRTFTDEKPGFAADGSFWFLRDHQEYVSADPTGRLTPRQLSLACFGRRGDDTYHHVVKSVAVLCPGGVVHPSGRFAAASRGVAQWLSTVQGFQLDLIAKKVDRYSDAPDFKPFAMQVAVRDDGEWRDCTPVTWLDATDLLCAGASNDYYTVAVDPALARGDLEHVQSTKVKVKAEIAPATETPIISVAVSRDRRSLIIAAGDDEAGTAKLYRASLVTPGDPVEIGPVPAELRENLALRRS